MFEGCPGGQPSLGYGVVGDCLGVMEGSRKQRNQLLSTESKKKGEQSP